MSCSFYDFRCNDYYCMKKKDYVSSDIYYKYCRGYDYDDCPIYKDEDNSGGCYLTTACVVAMDKGDNCEELNILRNFRDTYMRSDKSMCKDICEYYNIAPKIVEIINNSVNYKEIYKEIYNELVYPCVCFIKKEKFNDAYVLYKKKYMELKNKYIK